MSIGIIGCGKLGICYATLLSNVGLKVYCYDINSKILDDIRDDKYNYMEPSLNELIRINKENLIICDTINEVIEKTLIIMTFIQTPSMEDGSYNHKYINAFIDDCVKLGKQETLKTIVICSTVMPEYCDSILDIVKDYNYNIIYNPSFISQGSIIANIKNPDFILIGNNNEENKELINIHRKIIENDMVIFKMTRLHEAEIIKISINCYITMKISYANLIGDFARSLKCDENVILDAIGTDNRIGHRYLNYGYGFGGPCLPRDNKALYHYYKNRNNNENINFDICNIIDNNNKNHLMFQYEQLKNSKDPIYFTYITYKDTSNILEESQKLKLALLLVENENDVIIKERKEIIDLLKNKYSNYKNLHFIEI